MFLIIYITHPDEASARRVANELLEKRLVACANIFPMTSAYHWRGTIEHADEWVTLLKTKPSHWEAVCSLVGAIHPYETPCIMRWEATANAAYEAWIVAETD